MLVEADSRVLSTVKARPRLDSDVTSAYLFTVIRAPVAAAAALALGVSTRSATLTLFLVACGATSVATDFLDGRFEARYGRELPLRRVLDGCIDRLGIYAVLVAAAFAVSPLLLAPIAVVGLRDLLTGLANARLTAKGWVVRSPRIHSLGSAAHIALAFAIVVFGNHPGSWAVALVDVSVALTLGVDQRRRRLAFLQTAGRSRNAMSIAQL